jgi:hypothetical protein
LKTLRLFLVIVVITTTIVAGVRLSSVLMARPAASDESVLLKGFAEIQPIDVHTHILQK